MERLPEVQTPATPTTLLAARPGISIVGFAASWEDAPWQEPATELWGMNALHKAKTQKTVAAEKPWKRWFQLHDIDTFHKDDRDEHVAWLRKANIPVYMWREDAVKYEKEIPNIVYYPRDKVIERFGRYFTNTVSWMVALAIMEGPSHIGIYGVDMAQDEEYGHQRPSVEFFIGIAMGLGIPVFIPDNSDLLKAAFLYGAEDGNTMRRKYETRLQELVGRRDEYQLKLNNLQNEGNQLQAAVHQIIGAIEDIQYWLRVYTLPSLDGKAGGT